jgi:hypothetical protein
MWKWVKCCFAKSWNTSWSFKLRLWIFSSQLNKPRSFAELCMQYEIWTQIILFVLSDTRTRVSIICRPVRILDYEGVSKAIESYGGVIEFLPPIWGYTFRWIVWQSSAILSNVLLWIYLGPACKSWVIILLCATSVSIQIHHFQESFRLSLYVICAFKKGLVK